MKVVLVVARFSEDTGWLADAPCPVFIVQKGEHLPNVGREPSSYFWFMATQEIDPDTTYAFVQGNPWPHGFEWGQLREVNGYSPLGVHILDAAQDGTPHHGGLPLVRCMRDWLGMEAPPRFVFHAGAQFLVPGSVILSKPREWYAAMQAAVSVDPGPWVMERLWPHVWPHEAKYRHRMPLPPRLIPDLVGMVHGGVSPYQDLRPGELDLQGWNSESPIFEEVLSRVDARFVIEVGSWKGASAVTMGRMLQPLGGRLLCVDTWLGSREFVDDPMRRGWLQARHGWPHVYFTFLGNMVRTGLTNTVVPFPQTSATAARWCLAHGIQADVVYVDASHDEEDVADDVRRWWKVVRPGGILFGDDYDQHWPGVGRAVEAFAAELGLPVELHAPAWIIAKPA